jgi:hypothetical protein
VGLVRRCSVCGQQKPVDAFGVDSHAASGHRSDCKDCVNARARWRRTNPGVPTPRDQARGALARSGLKHCARCGRDLPVGSFYADSSRHDGHYPYCAECTKTHVAGYLADPEYRARAKAAARQNYYANRDMFRERARQTYLKHRSAYLEAAKARHERQREQDNSRVRDWYRENKEHVAEYQRRYKQSNRELVRARDRRRHGWRRRNDPRYVIDHRMARILSHSLGKEKAGRSWGTLLGFGVEELMAHLETQFVDGMTWENRGLWHIDHIIPRASFGYLRTHDPAFSVCWSIWNLRPLWGADNQRKSCSLPGIVEVPEQLRDLIAEAGLPGFEWLFDAAEEEA